MRRKIINTMAVLILGVGGSWLSVPAQAQTEVDEGVCCASTSCSCCGSSSAACGSSCSCK